MTSHDAHVLAGRVGSDSRTKKLNKMSDKIDEAVSQARDNDREKILLSSSYLATELNWSQSTICRNGFPDFFTRYFDSAIYKENKGLFVKTEKWVEERKEQREKIAELKEEAGE